MKNRLVLVILALCLLSGFSSLAFAEQAMMNCDKMCSMDKMMAKMDMDEMFFYKANLILDKAADIGLTNEQQEKVKIIRYNVKRALIKTDADIKTSALDIEEVLGKTEIDVNAVNGLIDKKYTMKAQRAKDLVNAYVELKSILTKEQSSKLMEMHKGGMMKKPMGGMMGKTKGMPMGH